jgi:hypothetical protein
VKKTLGPYLGVFCMVYLNYVFLYNKALEDHIHYVRHILEPLPKPGLQVKPQKYEFHKKITEYLRILITLKGLKINPSKVSAVE